MSGYTSAVINDTIQSDQEYVSDSVVIKNAGTAVGSDLYQVNYTQPQLSIIMDSTQKPDFNNWTITFQKRAKNYFNENTVGNGES